MQSPRLRIRASVFPALTTVAMLLTTCVSVTLTEIWQDHEDKRSIPYISDAHYDIKQSPVFTALITSTGILFILNTISTYITLCNRFSHLCPNPERCCLEPVFKVVSKMSLVLGCVVGICMVLTGALYSEFPTHAVAATTSGSALVLWSLSIVTMVKLISDTGTLVKRISLWLMIPLPPSLCGSLIAFVALRARDALGAVVMEYISVAIACSFMLLLCGHLHSFTLLLAAQEPEDTSPL